MVLGVDVAYYNKYPNFYVLITPTIGIGVSNSYISYDYAISTRKYPFNAIGKHQLRLMANLPVYYKNSVKNIGKWLAIIFLPSILIYTFLA